MTNEELVDLIQSGIDAKNNMGLLYQQNRNFIYKIAFPYSSTCDIEDLMQEAYFGLVDAVDRFDTNKGKFITYAAFWLKNKIQRYTENCGKIKRIPSYELQLMSKYHKFKCDFRDKNDHDPAEADYMKHLDISKKTLVLLEKHIHEAYCQSIDEPVPGANELTVGETLADDFNLEEAVAEHIDTERNKAVIWACVDELDNQQQHIIQSRYKRNMSLAAVGKSYGVTGQAIYLYEREALNILKKNEQLQSMATQNGYGCKAAYHYGLQRFKDTGTSSTEFIALKRIEAEQRIANVDSIMKMMNWF